MNTNDRDFQDVNFEEALRRGLNWIRKHRVTTAIIFLVMLLLFLLPTMVFSVDRNEQAITLLFGADHRKLGSGLHYKFPWPIEKAHIIKTEKTFSMDFGYRRPGAAGRRVSQRKLKHESRMLTGDLGVSQVRWQIQYRKAKPKQFLFNVHEHERIIREASFAAMRRIIGDYFVAEVITTAREQIRRKVKEELQKIMDEYRTGIHILGVELQSTEPPDEVKPAFKEVDSARQDRERKRNEAKQKMQRVLNEVQGKYEQQISEAKGEAAAIVNRAKGDAQRFENLIQQYEAAPNITEKRMFYDTMQEVMNESERVYVVDQQMKSLLPLLNLNQDGGSK